MKWIYLLITGALEITWAVVMKMSNGFTVPQVICVILIVVGIARLKILAKE